ncbi:hypothetical protein [Sphingomonas sp.]|uniref:hypothetical protein n=1 Tax=Sphingomonas sp. TaxID=28214 RepID=UPI0025FB5E0F|nr:hypothetical protein [Sphingomonas sp.]
MSFGDKHWPRRAIVALVLLLSLAVFFRDAALSHFTHFYGDSYDGMIEISILQHWYDVFVHGSAWSVTGYFHPYPDTISYNDTYFLPALVFTLARLGGSDPFLAAFVSHVLMKAAGFLGMYVLLRRGAAVRTWLALAGAAIFATANVSLLHMYHAQLLSVGLVPWLGFTALRTVQGVFLERPEQIRRFGVGFAVLFGLTAFNSFYMAWFFAFFTLMFAVVALVLAGKPGRASLSVAVQRQYPAVRVVLVAALVALVPLLLVYLPRVMEGAHHDWDSGISETVLGGAAFLNVGVGNLVWGQALDAGTRALTGHGPLGGEARVGIPYGLLIATVLALIQAVIQAGRQRGDNRLVLMLGCTLVVVIVLMMGWPGGFSIWRYVYQLVPGANAIRVITRFLIFALVPVVFIVVVTLDRTRWRNRALIPMIAFLLVEQVQMAAPLAMDRARQMAMLADVGPPPTACTAFFVVAARRDAAADVAESVSIAHGWSRNREVKPDLLLKLYRHNVDAMMIATYYNVPTINGVSTFAPPDWQFDDPDAPDYVGRVRDYASKHRLTGLCGLDVRRALHWYGMRKS